MKRSVCFFLTIMAMYCLLAILSGQKSNSKELGSLSSNLFQTIKMSGQAKIFLPILQKCTCWESKEGFLIRGDMILSN